MAKLFMVTFLKKVRNIAKDKTRDNLQKDL